MWNRLPLTSTFFWANNEKPVPWQALIHLCQTALWQFYQFDELNQDGSNWFGPNCCGLKAAISSAGFIVDHEHCWGHRVAFGAKKGERPRQGEESSPQDVPVHSTAL